MTFELFPAIDLRGGQVVRLTQGDFARETAYASDPLAVALGHVAAGARWLHVVDLDGARSGVPAQTEAVDRIVAAAAGASVRVQVAGGLRTAETVRSALDRGAARVVIGTAAIHDPAFAGGLVEEHGPEWIVVALDVRDGLALGEGWRIGALGPPVDDALRSLADVGVTTFAVTAIDRDGLLGGPDLELLGRLVALGRGAIIASGGVSSIDDILAVRDLGCGGAILGRALYEGRLDLRAALDAATS
jgi:phosphoribosylformimino-5-aminoimidazole carboxamide ribotide isomerase